MTLSKLENLIGYTFQNPLLLERALTHRSWAHENLPGRDENEIRAAENESLEFVGDSVLGLAIAEQLFQKYPDASEGQLTLMKHRLVSTTTLASIAEELQLGEFIQLGRGEEKTGGRQKRAILADTVEAIIAAVFFDTGYIAARDLISRMFASEFEKVTPDDCVDYKSLLQEKLQAERLSAPVYSVVRTEGLPHDRTFYVEAAWDRGRAEGSGSSIKSAEMMAASEALKVLQSEASAAAAKREG
ncbi:MAG TPA: ribonuclease III [Pyrinomonadaceae bacterium]|nr:ribonuclease III [Pyrinomonadaceae bacterium]